MNKRTSKAFTMIELVFVIVVMGILSKFGVEFLAQAYNSFIHTKINNELQSQSASAVEFVSSRLQHRIKNSVIAREANNNFFGLSGYSAGTAPILEWVGSDVEGFRGNSMPFWSGVIDLDPTQSSAFSLKSPETNTTAIDNLIGALSHGSGTGIDNAALYFIGSDSDINGYGWTIPSTGAFIDQNKVMHPIKSNATPDVFVPRNANTGADGNFTGVNVSEYYKLAWTAYAVGIDNYDPIEKDGNLTLWYDYQPWNGDTYKTKVDGSQTKKITIMENVSTFQFMAIGSLIKIQVCTNSALLSDEEYSICKEKTIY
ncbi:MAG: type II secretion system GspH family protein [Sulfurimonas sp.]|nr:type II secretion system GspH family protein [Sulfurimonas sp.]